MSIISSHEFDRLRSERPDLRVVDVRTPGEFAAGHIAGSYNVPLPTLAEHQSELQQPGVGPVVLVCKSGRRATAGETALRAAGLVQVHVLDGGMDAWQAAALPVARVDAQGVPWTIERQVRLVAGSIVLVSIALSLVWPQARFVAGAIGLGLVVAALTNTCTMGALLARLPYNRRAVACDLPTIVSELSGTKSQVKA